LPDAAPWSERQSADIHQESGRWFDKNRAMAKLRPANATDSDFCFELHRRTMGSVIVELFGPWDDDVQKEFHTRWFDPTRVQIIEDEAGRAIGVFDVRD
jgi:hypothetical protein